MTGTNNPKHRTDDIRDAVGFLLRHRFVSVVVTLSILAASGALLILSFAPNPSIASLCHSVVTAGLAVQTLDVCLRLISQRVEFVGKADNLARFAIVASALFSPFQSVLMLRVFPLVRIWMVDHRLPAFAAVPLALIWVAACLAAIARDVVLQNGESCAGWLTCMRVAWDSVGP